MYCHYIYRSLHIMSQSRLIECSLGLVIGTIITSFSLAEAGFGVVSINNM